MIWDLAPHDLSIMDYLIQEKPEALVATGQNHLNEHADVAYITVYFPEQHHRAHQCELAFAGEDPYHAHRWREKMLVWNDLDADEKIKIYDKGVNMKGGQGVYDVLVSYRSGDMWAPKVEQTEALRIEANVLCRCVLNEKTPINDGHVGLDVVRMLEAADVSLKERGKIIRL